MSEQNSLRFGRIVVWAVVAVIIAVLGLAVLRSFNPPANSGRAPDFTLETYESGEITLTELRGQVVVINFWASWCGPCIEEAPDLEQAWRDYRDRGVVFLGVGYVDSEDRALAFIEEHGITYPNGPDLGTRISDAYSIRGVPETFVITPEGEISFYAPRPVTYNELTREINRALSGR